MLKIGEREITPKELTGVVLLILIVFSLLWYLLWQHQPAPVIGVPGQGLELMEGGQPGSAPGQFAYPRGVAVDSKGDLYVADSRNNRIQKFSGKVGSDGRGWKFLKDFGGLFDEAKASGGVSQKLATGALGKFHEPNGVAIGPNDSVYVMDTWNNRVQVFNSNGGIKFAYTTDDGFFAPREIAVDPNGFSYVADTGKHRVVKFDPKGQKVMSIGATDPKTGQFVPGSKDGQFNEPIGLAVDQGGNLYVADRLNFRIQVFGPDGQFVRKWTTKWLIPLQANGVPEQVDIEPHLAMNQAHGLVYVTDGKGKKVFCYKLDGTLVSTLETNTTGAPLFAVPIGVAVDKDSNVYVVDAGLGKIIKLKGQFQ